MSAKVESIPGGGVRPSGHGSIAWWAAGAVSLLVVAAMAGSAFVDDEPGAGAQRAGGNEIAAVEAGVQLTPQLTAMARAGVAPSVLAGLESQMLRAQAYGAAEASVQDSGSRPQVKGGGGSGGSFQGTMGGRTAPNDAGGLCQAC